jgi:hypothetical protein
MNSLRVIAAFVVTGLALATPSANAAGSFSTPRKVLKTNCSAQTVLDKTGARHGFGQCPNQGSTLYYVSAKPNAKWSMSKTSIEGTVVSVADDGSSTYALVGTNHGTLLLTRSRSGQLRHTTVSRFATGPINGGAIIASHGKWFAVFPGSPKDSDATCPPIYVVGTLGASRHAKRTKLCGIDPALALTSKGKPMSAMQAGAYQVGNDIVVNTWKHGRPSKSQVVAKHGHDASISVAKNTTRVEWSRVIPSPNISEVPALATRTGHGKWHVKKFTAPTVSDDFFTSMPQVVASGHMVFVGWTVEKGGKERVEIEESSGGRWTSHLLTDGTKAGDAVFLDLGVVHGKAYIALGHSDQTRYELTTHQ